MAMGYVTLYGDMCGGLGVLVDVSKTLVYALAKWINRKREIIPMSIIKKEPCSYIYADVFFSVNADSGILCKSRRISVRSFACA